MTKILRELACTSCEACTMLEPESFLTTAADTRSFSLPVGAIKLASESLCEIYLLVLPISTRTAYDHC